jgi:hypothetical protein
MATGALLPSGYETLVDAAGATIPGGLIWTYQAGTTVAQATYTDSSLTVVNQNPIIADGAGRWVAYSPPGTVYKLVYETPAIPPAHGTVLRTVDNVSGPVFAGQLQFPVTQVSSSDPNVLDDYEEGTWTPILGGSGGQSGQTYAIQGGQYVKVGRLVTVSFDTLLTAKGTITGQIGIYGLPFGVAIINTAGPVSYFSGWTTPKVFVAVLASGFQATVFGLSAAATVVSAFATADITDAQRIVGSVTYSTNT